MRIGLNAHLLAGNAGYRSAGIHNYIAHLLRHLPSAMPQDWQLAALVGAENTLIFEGIQSRRSRMNTASPMRRIVWEQLAQPFALGGFDAYHALAFVSPLLLFKPSVVTIYDLSFVHYPERLPASRRLYLQTMARFTAQRAKRVIAISEATAQDIHKTWQVDRQKIDVAAPGYNSAEFRPLAQAEITGFRAQKGLPERFWLFIGTLEPRKNLITLLEGYAAMPPEKRLPLIVGGGRGWDYEPIFAAVEKHKLGSLVQFPGFIPAEELAFWYNSAETFIYPSVFEGFGLPVLEAMACGTPVVVSRASSLIEVAEEAGMMVDPYAPENWTQALMRAYDDREWHTNARERGLVEARRYSWENTAQQTAASYRQAFESG